MSNGNGVAIVRSAADKQRTLMDLFDQRKDAIKALLPRHLTPERMLKIALATTARTPALLACTPQSIVLAVMQAAELGLEPGGLLGEAYLVPYRAEAKLIVGYRGMVALARRSGTMASIEAHVVHANDVFDVEYGLDPKLSHRPSLSGDPGDVVAAYAIARFKDGSRQVDVMTRAEIDAIRARSGSANAGPWVTDFAEMAKKTVVRRLAKMLPLSPELQKAVAHENRLEENIAAPVFDVDIVMDTTATEVPSEPDKAADLAAKINGKAATS